MSDAPSEDDVLGYFDTLSNWGKWGQDDERGTLNYVTPAKVVDACREVVEGVTIGCARPIEREGPVPDVLLPPLRFVLATHESPAESRIGSLAPVASTASDFLALAPHGTTTTHVDTLAHFSRDGLMYNGIDASNVSALLGATRLSVTTMKNGIITRGVLLDIARAKNRKYLEAGEGIYPEDLEAAEHSQRVTVGEGDALLIRTGWYRRRLEVGPYPERLHRPGLHAASLPWLHERRVAIIAADASHDVGPSGYDTLVYPVHSVGTVAMGLCMVDACDLEALAQAASERDKWSFMLVLAPLNWPGATGSPATPVAIL